MDIEDFWSCNLDYHNFVIDEPTTEQAMVQFYVFNVECAGGAERLQTVHHRDWAICLY